MSTRFHDSDCAIHRGPAYPACEVGCDCRLAELDKWEASYNAVCDERDAIAKDCDKAHALLRQALVALEAALSDDQPYIEQSKQAVADIKEFLE